MPTMGGAVREEVQGTPGTPGINRFVMLASWFVILASVTFMILVILTKLF
jgi:hypothetical protein